LCGYVIVLSEVAFGDCRERFIWGCLQS
jgi:hypothetical protein